MTVMSIPKHRAPGRATGAVLAPTSRRHRIRAVKTSVLRAELVAAHDEGALFMTYARLLHLLTDERLTRRSEQR